MISELMESHFVFNSWRGIKIIFKMRYFVEIVSTVLLMANFVGAQRQGDLCVVAGTIQPGVCRHVLQCSAVLEAAFHGMPYQVCASPENRLIVCCPWVPGQETGLEARRQANTTTPREGDKCTVVDTGKAGVCSRFSNCQTAKEAAHKGIFPQVCGLQGTAQLVCCPLVTVVEGDECTVADTGRAGKCLRISKCPIAVEAALKGRTPQICALDGSIPVVCCERVVEGSHCTLKNTGMAGVCRPFADCQTAKEAACKSITQKCDINDIESELVCCEKTVCPPLPKGLVTQLPVGSKAADYCIELADKIYPCQETRFGWTRGNMCPLPTPDSNVLYHQTPMATTAEAPYYGQIGHGKRGAISWTGRPVTLVSDQWVLCSARAIENIGSNNVQFVGLGGNFTVQYKPDEIYDVTKQILHPLYNSSYSRHYNSIALIQLDRRVTFTARIQPACLHTGTPLPDSGFILTGRENLLEAKTTMQTISHEECTRQLPGPSSSHPDGIIHDLEICSRPVNTTTRCPNWYYGAQLTLHNSRRVACTHLLVGLRTNRDISSCIFTNVRISSYIPWIEGIVWPESGLHG